MDGPLMNDLIRIALDQANAAIEYEKDNREKALEDTEFVFAEDQWDEAVENSRGNRPCLNANDLPVFLDKVTAAQRMNRAGIKVLPVDSDTDPLKAEIVGGLIRYIEYESDAHVAYDMAIEAAAAGGYCGAIRVINEYENDDIFDNDGNIKPEYRKKIDAFNQRLRIAPVHNPLNLLFDPKAKLWHKNDGDFMFYMDDIPIDDFKEQYPDAQIIDFESEELPADMKDWYNLTDKTVRVAEWFRKEPKGSHKIYLILNEEEEYEVVKEKPEDETRILKEREIEDYDIIWRKITATDVLEGPTRIPGKLWPIIPVWGKEHNINGKHMLRGLFRYVKDPQRMYIYTQSAITELLALQPKTPFIGTAKMFEGHEAKWRTANTKDWPYLPVNPDNSMPGVMPRREMPPQIPTGLVEQGQQRQIEKKDIIGLHEASLGKRSNETSGRAIYERKTSDDATTYAFHDNLTRAIRQVGRVIENMRPEIYDTPRVLRLLGMDKKTIQTQPVNQRWQDQNGEEHEPIDLTIGKHDIVVQTGPSYATQRQEALDRLQGLMQYAPAIAPVIADVLVDYMDIPRGEKLVRRLEAMLPPEIKAVESGEQMPSKEEIAKMIQDAIEQFKESIAGQIQAAKTEQQALKVEQQKLQLEEERLRLAKEALEAGKAA